MEGDTTMATKHNISRAGQLFYGAGYRQGAFATNKRAGAPINPLTKIDLGTPIAIAANTIVVAATGAEMPNASTKTYTVADDNVSPIDGVTLAAPSTVFLNGADRLVWVLDVPRNISSVQTNAGTTAATTIVILGYDVYGQPMTESLSLPATATTISANGKKAFKYFYSIAITSAADATGDVLNMGWGDVLGLPYVLTTKSDLLSTWAAEALDTVGTVVVADTNTATATTGDVRGTINPTGATGSNNFKVWVNLYPETDVSLFGVTQF